MPASLTDQVDRGVQKVLAALRHVLDGDLLIVDGDATADVSSVHNVRTVVSRGRLITSAN